jgi:hypothetical protein
MRVVPPTDLALVVDQCLLEPGGTVTKSGREIMEILAAFDLTRCAHSAAQLAGVDEKTVARYVAVRDGGGDPLVRARRVRSVEPFLPKVEEWVDQSQGRIRADRVHERLVVLGFAGTDRSTRRAVAEVKAAWRAGHRRSYRPWIPEPGMWLQFDWGEGPRIGGRRTSLFCAWLSWSRFRVVIPTWDQTLGTLVSCVDATLRRLSGAPAPGTSWARPAHDPPGGATHPRRAGPAAAPHAPALPTQGRTRRADAQLLFEILEGGRFRAIADSRDRGL